MKKKLKALLQGSEPINNAEVNRLKKAFEAAKLKFQTAKATKIAAKRAFQKSAEQWLVQAEVPHAPLQKKEKKAPKTGKPKGEQAGKRTKAPANIA